MKGTTLKKSEIQTKSTFDGSPLLVVYRLKATETGYVVMCENYSNGKSEQSHLYRGTSLEAANDCYDRFKVITQSVKKIREAK